MRHIIIIALIMMVPASALCLPSVARRLDSGSILSDITIPDGQLWAHVNVQAVIDSPQRAVWNALKDIEGWPRWLPMNRKARFLSAEAQARITPEIADDRKAVLEIDVQYPPAESAKTHGGHWQQVAYEEYDLPWPLKNQWVVRRYTYDENDGSCRASWRLVNTRDGMLDGFWEVTPWKAGKTHLRYYYRVKAMSGVPKLAFKAAVALTVNSMVKALRRESARRGDENPLVPFKGGISLPSHTSR